MSRPGSLEKLRRGLNHKNFVHYVPDSGHIDVLDRLGVWEGSSIQRYVVPAQNIFLSGDRRANARLDHRSGLVRRQSEFEPSYVGIW